MKKIIAAAAGLMMVGVMASSASAVESKFGGYWRTRGFSQIDFAGDDTFARMDTRTRLYYTAIFNENFKFVNKFEFDAVWGETGGSDYGDLGSDGVAVEVKNSYADFKLGNTRLKVGVQGTAISRGFIFDNDFAGVMAIFNAGAVKLPFAWIKVGEQESISDEADAYAVMPKIKVSDAVSLTPNFVYFKEEGTDTNTYWAGIDADAKFDAFSAWGTFIYNFGEDLDLDVSAFLVAVGAKTGPVHGQVFYATGDDDPLDGDAEDFQGIPGGDSYYWAEILGLGTFDNQAPLGAPGDQISNVWAANVGAKIKPMDKLTVGGDLWYASLVEDNALGEDELGIEIDLKATYALMDNLKLDLVAAYLLAGDAVNLGDDDPVEIGARLSLSF